jgi:hypothetical protein
VIKTDTTEELERILDRLFKREASTVKQSEPFKVPVMPVTPSIQPALHGFVGGSAQGLLVNSKKKRRLASLDSPITGKTWWMPSWRST